MGSNLTWLDSSREDQRRMRGLISLFADHESRDELGVGQIRDAFSDLMFPGTSTIHTRARYFLIVPWCWQEAQRKGQPAGLAARAERNERTVIEALKRSGDPVNMIGGRAGVKVRTLPSAIYGAGLVRYGIRTGDNERDVDAAESDELTERHVGMWHPTLPPPPAGFPAVIGAGLTMTPDESQWLKERVLATAPDTLLTYLLDSNVQPDRVSEQPWTDPSTAGAPDPLATQLDHARRFSMAIRGAALLFNLLIAEWYERKELTDVVEPVDIYRSALTDWAADIADARVMCGWVRRDMWRLTEQQNSRIGANVRTRAFVERWLDIVSDGPDGLAENNEARRLVSDRERQVKGSQSRLVNEKLLRAWRGSSGSRPLAYRWPQVRRMILDIRDGMEVSDVAA